MVGSPPVMTLTIQVNGPNGTKKTLESVETFRLREDGLRVTYPDRFEEQGVPTEELIEGDVRVLHAAAELMWL